MEASEISHKNGRPHVRGVPCVLDTDPVYLALNRHESVWLCPHCLSSLKSFGGKLVCETGCHLADDRGVFSKLKIFLAQRLLPNQKRLSKGQTQHE